MRYFGIDPGFEGAVAVLDDEGRVMEVAATPIRRGEGGRRAYNHEAIKVLLLRLMGSGGPRGVFITIEWQHAMPFKFGSKDETGEPTQTGGSQANFCRGLGLGVWETAVAFLGVPCETRLLVRAQEWQGVQLAGAPEENTKAKSIAQARRLWPRVSLLASSRSRSESDGIADALHLAQYGRMVHKGGPVFAALRSGSRAAADVDVFR